MTSRIPANARFLAKTSILRSLLQTVVISRGFPGRLRQMNRGGPCTPALGRSDVHDGEHALVRREREMKESARCVVDGREKACSRRPPRPSNQSWYDRRAGRASPTVGSSGLGATGPLSAPVRDS